MGFGRWIAGAVISLASLGVAGAAPIDPLPDGNNALGYDSVDIHNISMGFWDPVNAAMSPAANPGLGGNVTYTLAGTPIWWRLSFYAPSVCFISVPDYVNGSNVSWGGGASDVTASADSTVDASRGLYGDMRLHGCPECPGRGAENLTGACARQWGNESARPDPV